MNERRGRITASAILGIALIACALIARATLIRVKSFGQTISVTGAASRSIASDLAIWEANITASAPTLAPAYARIKVGLQETRGFLLEAGLSEQQIRIGGVQVNRTFDRDGQPVGYSLFQSVEVQLPDADRVARLAQSASALIEKGVELTSFPPRYVFTKLDDLKIEMIRAATENARARAQQLAEMTGRRVGAPVSARVGVFQIRPAHSQEVSDYGVNDLTSIEKEIVSTVQVSFLIE